MNLIPVENQKDLYRDPRTNAIINTNKTEYESYVKRRESIKNEKNRVDKIEDDINSVKEDLNEIKSLLKKLVSDESR
jgi:hypothetical protein